MNSIDFHDSCVRNEEYGAKRQAQLENIYLKEKNRLASYNNTVSYDNNVNNRLSTIERRIDNIERKVNEIYSCINNNGKLFVFAPEGNINSSMSFQLTPAQFKELMKSINK